MAERVFLDANVIFSAALGGAGFAALWDAAGRGALSPCTSPECLEEAKRNLLRKRPGAVPALLRRLEGVAVVPTPARRLEWARALLPEDDAWVLAAAVESACAVLLTGNTRHFGPLMARGDLPLRVLTPRAFLDERRLLP